MKKAERDRAKEIIGLWITFHEKQIKLAEIAVSGPTQESKMMEYQGDFPQLSDFKPDILSIKAEKQRRIPITKDERRANTLISAFPDKLRRILTDYELLRNKHNSGTGKPWTHADVAVRVKMPLDRYHTIREYLLTLLVEVDKAQHVVGKACSLHNILKKVVA